MPTSENHTTEKPQQPRTLCKLLTVKGGKFKFYAQRKKLAPFIGNVTKVKISSEINPPLFKRDYV
jgi:hypothetical protein